MGHVRSVDRRLTHQGSYNYNTNFGTTCGVDQKLNSICSIVEEYGGNNPGSWPSSNGSCNVNAQGGHNICNGPQYLHSKLRCTLPLKIKQNEVENGKEKKFIYQRI